MAEYPKPFVCDYCHARFHTEDAHNLHERSCWSYAESIDPDREAWWWRNLAAAMFVAAAATILCAVGPVIRWIAGAR